MALLVGVFFTCQARATVYEYNLHGTRSFTDDTRRVPKAADGVHRHMISPGLWTHVERYPRGAGRPVEVIIVPGPAVDEAPSAPPVQLYHEIHGYPTCHHDYQFPITNPLEQPWHTCTAPDQP